MNARRDLTAADFRHWVWLPVLLHVVMAVVGRLVFGVSMEIHADKHNWNMYWQNIPDHLLRSDLWNSVWCLHSQPPLYSLISGFFVKCFWPEYLTAMHYANILLGGLISGMTYLIVRRVCGSRWLALALSVAVAMHPALLVYEAFPIYTVSTAFLVMLCVLCVALFRGGSRLVPLYAFLVVLTLLVLTRSMYHVLLFAVFTPLLCILAEGKWRRVLAVAMLCAAVSSGWYVKNLCQYGFFGSSPWGAMILWRTVATPPRADLPQLVRDGVVDGAAAENIINGIGEDRPSTFAAHGFAKQSDKEVLSADDYHNINIPDISRLLGRNAVSLILYDPGRYAARVLANYTRRFCRPSTEYFLVRRNTGKIYRLARLYEILQGGAVMGPFGTALVFLLPLAVLFYAVAAALRCQASAAKWREYLREDAATVTALAFVLYTTVMVCAVCSWEHERYKFLVEHLIWILLAVMACRCVARVRCTRTVTIQIEGDGRP